MSEREVYYCNDEGQGFDHRCVFFADGYCGQKERCKHQLSHSVREDIKQTWEENKASIKREFVFQLHEKLDEILEVHTSEKTEASPEDGIDVQRSDETQEESTR